MRSFLLVLLLHLAPVLYLYSAENPPSPQGQTNLPANQSLGDDPSVTVEPPPLQHRAEQGDVEAQYLLGLKYEHGEGVPQDYVEARKWFLKAAEQGNAEAQSILGIFYMNGEGGPQDYVEARRWFLKAAEQGEVGAQKYLGAFYLIGKGIPQDYVEARKWFLKAAEQGNAEAQNNLGFIYSSGQGVPQDYVTACAWANIAAAQGNETAKRNRDLSAAKLDAASLGEAQKLSKDYFKRYVEPFQ